MPAVVTSPGRHRTSIGVLAAALAGGICLVGWTSAGASGVPEHGAVEAALDEQRIEFAPGTDNAVRDGRVAVGSTDRWILRAFAGQWMDLAVDSADDNTVFSLFAPDRTVLATVSNDTFWSGPLPSDGDYSVEVTSLDGPAYYVMKVWIDAGFRDPLGLVQRMSFAPGTDSGSASGAVVRASFDTWVLWAAAGQTMEVSVTSLEANSTFDVFTPSGSPLTAVDERTTWTGVLPEDGDYRIAVQPTRGNSTYFITVRITGGFAANPTQQSPAPQGSTGRISFAPGSDHGIVNEVIAPGAVDRWILRAAAGQTMAVFIESDVGFISADIYDPDGIALAIAEYEVAVELPSDGDYTVAVYNDSGIVGAYTLTVYIT
jgi:hypothetical protein